KSLGKQVRVKTRVAKPAPVVSNSVNGRIFYDYSTRPRREKRGVNLASSWFVTLPKDTFLPNRQFSNYFYIRNAGPMGNCLAGNDRDLAAWLDSQPVQSLGSLPEFVFLMFHHCKVRNKIFTCLYTRHQEGSDDDRDRHTLPVFC